MKITAEERLMYGVMKAIYESGIPVSFKGSMVLKACLIEAGYAEDTRHTVDIDANWNSEDMPTDEQMRDSIQEALRTGGIDLNVSICRMYGEGRSAGFALADPAAGRVLFTMDVDVNRPVIQTRMYEIEGVRFRGASVPQMLADKLIVVSGEKVFRRIKDLIDLYYLSGVFAFDREDVLRKIADSGRRLGSFDGFLNRPEELRHAYDKFRFAGDVRKPAFGDVYQTVRAYIAGALPEKSE